MKRYCCLAIAALAVSLAPTLSNAEETPSLDEMLSRHSDPLPPDPAFDRYFDADEFLDGVATHDARGVVDAALGIIHGQSVLLRERNGAATRDIIDAAARIAAESGATEELNRLSLALQGDQWQAQAALVKETGERAKRTTNDSSALHVDLATTTREQFQRLKVLHDGLRRAELAGDAEHAKAIKQHLDDATDLRDGHKTRLSAAAELVIEGKNGGSTNPLLSRLNAASRGTGPMTGTWNTTYTAPDGSPVQATVTMFDNAQGTYDTGAGRGSLAISYCGAPLGGGAATTVMGRWRYVNGQTGRFTWKLADDHFDGTWCFDGNNGPPNGTWSGDRADGDADPNIDPATDNDLPPNNGGGVPGGDDPSGGATSLDDVFGTSWQSDNGSNCIVDAAGGIQVQDPSSGMFLPGKLMTRNGKAIVRMRTRAGRMADVPVTRPGRNQLRIGGWVYKRKR